MFSRRGSESLPKFYILDILYIIAENPLKYKRRIGEFWISPDCSDRSIESEMLENEQKIVDIDKKIENKSEFVDKILKKYHNRNMFYIEKTRRGRGCILWLC